MTSPPYYALRDYGMDGQIGREDTPQKYVARLTDVFTEVRRVLRPAGTLFLNISDTYAGKSNQGENLDPKYPDGRTGQAVAINRTVDGCKSKDMLKDYPDVMNIEQMCEILGVSTKTGYRILRSGQISCLKVGRAYRIPKAHLFTFLSIGCFDVGEAMNI